jgi:hypothetical protein
MMTYATPPGSGNAYARDFVAKAYAVAPPTMRWPDDVRLILVPTMGEIMTIRKALVRCRVRNANSCALGSLDTGRFCYRMRDDVVKAALLAEVWGNLSLPVARDRLARPVRHLLFRLASCLAQRSAHPFPEDRLSRLLWRLAYSMTRCPQMRFQNKSVLTLWAAVCAFMPPRYRRSLVEWRLAAASRPALLGSLLAIFTSLPTPCLPDRA